MLRISLPLDHQTLKMEEIQDMRIYKQMLPLKGRTRLMVSDMESEELFWTKKSGENFGKYQGKIVIPTHRQGDRSLEKIFHNFKISPGVPSDAHASRFYRGYESDEDKIEVDI